MVEYYTTTLSGSMAVTLAMQVPADRLDDLLADFDSVLNNVTGKGT